jgi:RNA-binding protein
LLQVGILLHQAKSGRLIFKLSKEVRPGAVLLDDKGRKIGKVTEIIGPVKSPYASVAAMTGRFGIPGSAAYLEG